MRPEKRQPWFPATFCLICLLFHYAESLVAQSEIDKGSSRLDMRLSVKPSIKQDRVLEKFVGNELFRLQVNHAGEFDCENVVVRTLIELDDHERSAMKLIDHMGNSIMGQLSPPTLHSAEKATGRRELTFVLPALKKGEMTTLTASNATPVSDTQFEWHDDKYGTAELRFGDQGVTKYMYESLDDSTPDRRGETCKVYHHVFSPDGTRLITKGPGGLFPHHRGVFFGYNKISYGDGKHADVWHCNQGESQTQETSLAQIAGPVFGRDVNVIYWRGQDGQPFAKEIRETNSFRIDGGILIEFNSLLKALGGPVRLAGDPQHAGVQFRASQNVPDHTKQLTYYIRPDGIAAPGEFRNWSSKKDETENNKNHVDLKWHALCIALPFQNKVNEVDRTENRRLTICYLDRPSNPKPARFSERDYGRFGSYFEYNLTPSSPLRVSYRFWIQEGEMTVEEIDSVSNSFLLPVEVEQRQLEGIE